MNRINVLKLIEEIKKYPKFQGTYSKEMSVKDFAKIKKYPKETILINESSPLANDAYPNKFNLSVSEYIWSEMCKEKGFVISKGIFDYTALPEHSFWITTKNIRDEDIDNLLSGSNQHLLLFHIIGVGGFSVTSSEEKNREFYITTFINFLSKYFGDLSKLKIAFFNGGLIEKHSIKKVFSEDINKEIYEKLSKQFNFKMFPTSEETFLALRVFGSPIFWGYRNEFFINHKDSQIDIGTIECLPYIPKYTMREKVVEYLSIEESKKIFIGSGAGLERMIMVLENVNNIWEISIISPLIDLLREKSKNNVSSRILFIISEILRVFHYLISERGGLTAGELRNKHRREAISKFLSTLIAGIVTANLTINKSFIQKFIELNKKLNIMDEKDLSTSDKVANMIFCIIEEQLRFYKTSEKYRQKIKPLIQRLEK